MFKKTFKVLFCLIVVGNISVSYSQSNKIRSIQLKKSISDKIAEFFGYSRSEQIDSLKKYLEVMQDFNERLSIENDIKSKQISVKQDSLAKLLLSIKKCEEKNKMYEEIIWRLEQQKHVCDSSLEANIKLRLLCDSVLQKCNDRVDSVRRLQIECDSLLVICEEECDSLGTALDSAQKTCLDSTFEILGKYKMGRGYSWVDLNTQRKLNPKKVTAIKMTFTVCDPYFTDEIQISIKDFRTNEVVSGMLEDKKVSITNGYCSTIPLSKTSSKNWFKRNKKYMLVLTSNINGKPAVFQEIKKLFDSKGSFAF